MKRVCTWLIGAAIVLCIASTARAACTTIQMGTLTYRAGHYLAGQPLATGYDVFGYNYQAHMFNGSYFNAYAGGDGLPPYEGDDTAYLAANPLAATHWAWPYRNDNVMIKWNDAWLSNKDCNGDGRLDRPDDFGGTYIGSGAWETNHMSGSYIAASGKKAGKEVNWVYFVKIVAVPADAVLQVDGYWYTPGGVAIGQGIWGAFAIVEEINNDPAAGFHGLAFKSQASPGFGFYKP